MRSPGEVPDAPDRSEPQLTRRSGHHGSERIVVEGFPLDAIDPETALEVVLQRAEQRVPCSIHLVNSYTLALAAQDSATATAIRSGDLNLPDGAPVAWLCRALGAPSGRPVPGPDLMEAVLSASNRLRHFFYGSTDEVLRGLQQEVQNHLGATVAGSFAPPFREPDEESVEQLAQMVAASEADLVWVGLGTPRQDLFLEAAKHAVEVPLIAVGAAFDFHAGESRRAPRLLRGTGLEWIHRLLTEPRRLWRRYLVFGPRFLVLAARALLDRRGAH